MAFQVLKLGPPHAGVLQTLLTGNLAENLYLLGLLEELGIAPAAQKPFDFGFFGCFEGELLRAAVFAGDTGSVVPVAGKPAEVAEIAKHLAARVQLLYSIGERSSVASLVRYLCASGPRFSRTHRLLTASADALGPFVTPNLRLATDRDLPALITLAAGAVRETLERDPMREGADPFAARVLRLVRARRTYVMEVEGTLVAKIDIKGRSQFGAELDGLYTAPDERLRGYATLCLGQLSRHLLSSLPRLTLRVDEAREGMMTVARKVGFADRHPEQLLVLG
jgi:RimJ/RimL family protein N-acetyltransferase